MLTCVGFLFLIVPIYYIIHDYRRKTFMYRIISIIAIFMLVTACHPLIEGQTTSGTQSPRTEPAPSQRPTTTGQSTPQRTPTTTRQPQATPSSQNSRGSQVNAGLKEALRIGAQRAVASTSREDGFFANELIHIPIPSQLQDISNTARAIGLSSYVDEFELSMNRAAEQAAGEALNIFVDAISSLTIADGFAILNGGNQAATNLLRERTQAQLTERFRPIVNRKMQQTGVYGVYRDISQAYERIPFRNAPDFDLEEYVVTEATDGLFDVLGREEARIRQEPIARTTDLLRDIFGR